MRNTLFILTFILLLSAGGSFPAFGQEAIRAERMVVTHAFASQDTVPGTKRMEAAEVPGFESSEQAAIEATDQAMLKTSDQAAGEVLAGAPSENSDAAEAEAAQRVAHIWEEIDNTAAGPDRPGVKAGISPWSFSTSVGTSFISYPRFGSAMNMYAAPQVNFAATKRLGFHAGVSVGRTLPVTGLVTDENLLNSGMTNISTYVAASYLLTENLVIHGTGSRSTFMMPVNGTLQSVHYNDLSIGATYHFGNFSIGATIHHSDAPVFGSPFGNGSSIYGSPFYW